MTNLKMEAPTRKKCLAIGGCTALIMVVVILATTFKTQKETEICLKYDTVSRVVDPNPDTLPGTKALGPFTDLICYPKTVQKFEFSASSGASLRTRTKEGLSIGLDVTIEYKFVTSKLLNLFELTGPYPTPVEAARALYQRLALRTIINVASRYAANAFLSEQRGNISATMSLRLIRTLKNIMVWWKSLQMRNVVLDKTFVEAIDDILGEKLLQTKLLKERESSLASAYKTRQVETQKYVSRRQQDVINIQKDISSAISNRAQEAIVIQQDHSRALEGASSRKVNKIATKKGQVNDAYISRAGVLQKGKNDAAVRTIAMTDKAAIAKVKASGTRSFAKAAADATIKAGKAQAERIGHEKDAQAEHYGRLLSADIGMSINDVLQYTFLSSLQDTQKDANMFRDTRKYPY